MRKLFTLLNNFATAKLFNRVSCYIVTLLTAALLMPNFTLAATSEVLNMADKLTDKKEQLKSIEDDLNYYRQKISETQKKTVSLKNQIELLNDQIKKTELEIQEADMRVSQLDSNIADLNSGINNTKKNIELQKDLVAYYLRELQRTKGKSPLEIFLLQPSFSKFFDEMRNLEVMQNNLADSIEKLRDMQNNLEKSQSDLKDKKEQILKLKKDSQNKKAKLEAQKTTKTFLIGETFVSEAKFQALLIDTQKEQRDLDAEISRLENAVKDKLRQNDLFPSGSVILTWPVPKDEITTYFHDPDYPYRYILGEHAGLDIRASQGTPIAAPAPGYVLKVRDSKTWREYSYVVMAHAGGISSVYIHLSKVYVKPDTYVARGQIIGLTGGMPRTVGAGLWTTGPHLHFEIRANGIPVNPLDYLTDL